MNKFWYLVIASLAGIAYSMIFVSLECAFDMLMIGLFCGHLLEYALKAALEYTGPPSKHPRPPYKTRRQSKEHLALLLAGIDAAAAQARRQEALGKAKGRLNVARQR
ncbi:MAG: hypothetical protein EOP64_00325 [Sphingomonas sp.]|nr:MAG: hypothetical protein EOP64_00325 [Sphingomonas sp.]